MPFSPLAVGDRVAFRPGDVGTGLDGTVAIALESRYRVVWNDSAPNWFNRADLVARGDDDAEDYACRECPNALGDAGYDGLCGDCADHHENKRT